MEGNFQVGGSSASGIKREREEDGDVEINLVEVERLIDEWVEEVKGCGEDDDTRHVLEMSASKEGEFDEEIQKAWDDVHGGTYPLKKSTKLERRRWDIWKQEDMELRTDPR